MITFGPTEAFFRSPEAVPRPDGDCVLYWLRRGIVRLCGPEGTQHADPREAGLVATSLILTGIDFLGRVQAGGPPECSRSSFIAVLSARGSVSSVDAEIIYQLRCGLAHSFSLSAVSRAGRNFDFTLCDEGSLVALDPAANNAHGYLVNFWALRAVFDRIVTQMLAGCQGGEMELANTVARMGEEKIQAR